MTAVNFAEPHFGNIPLACVFPSKTNPRKHFDETALAELSESIKQHGVAQPILVRPLPTTEEMIDCVEIVAGERRYRAAKLAGLEMIPAIVRQLTDVQALELQIIENLQRKDVHEIEEAEGYDRLMKEHSYTADQLAEKVGKSRSYIYGRLKFCALVPAAREAFFGGKLSASIALLIARIPVEKLQEQATEELTNGENWSFREARDFLQNRYMLDLTRAPFSLVDAKLVSSAGSCQKCPNRTGNQPEIFEDIGRADMCTDPDCFAVKGIAHGEKSVAQARRKGVPVYESRDEIDDESLVSSDSKLWDFERRTAADHWKKVGELLGVDDRPTPSAYIADKDGKVVELYDKTSMQAALEKAGLCATEEEYRARQEQREKEANAKAKPPSKEDAAKAKAAEEREQRRKAAAQREQDARIMAYRRVREQCVANGLWVEMWRLVAHELFGQYNVPSDEFPDVYPPQSGSYLERQTKIRKFIDAATNEQLQLMILDMLVASALSVETYNLDDDDQPDLEDDENYALLTEVLKAGSVDIDAARDLVAKQATPGSIVPLVDGFLIGEQVKVRDDAKGPNGRKRKCAGKTGSVVEYDGDTYAVRFGLSMKKDDVVYDLAADELIKVDASDEAQTHEEAPAAVEDPPKKKSSAKKKKASEKAAEPESANPAAAWPFPTSPRP